MEICRIATSNTEYLSFPKSYLNLLKDLVILKGKLCGLGQSTYLSDSEITVKSSTWKLLANSSTAVIRNNSTEVRKNWRWFLPTESSNCSSRESTHAGLLTTLQQTCHLHKTTLRAEIVLFVLCLTCDRKGFLWVHESQVPIVVSRPSEPLRCHECQRKRFSQHVCFKKCCEDEKEKKRAGGWNGLGCHKW